MCILLEILRFFFFLEMILHKLENKDIFRMNILMFVFRQIVFRYCSLLVATWSKSTSLELSLWRTLLFSNWSRIDVRVYLRGTSHNTIGADLDIAVYWWQLSRVHKLGAFTVEYFDIFRLSHNFKFRDVIARKQSSQVGSFHCGILWYFQTESQFQV